MELGVSPRRWEGGMMDERRPPLEVTVIVYSAKDLQAHKKGDECHASVVFGHGKDFYTTEVVESCGPEWNQEASLCVSGHCNEPIRFKVKDKEHTLGSVTVPLSGLGNSPNKFWLPLQPHKRASEAHGSLQLSCWVRSDGEESRGTRKTTGSCATSDIQEAGPHSDTEPEAEKEEGMVPEVTGVSPNTGPVQGGQRVVLRGSYLGESREDVVQVLVAGVDCTSSLDYFSPSKLAVVTGSRAAPGSGPVVVQTRTGGAGISWINFSFTADEFEATERIRKAKHEVHDSPMKEELVSHRQQLRELKDRNKSLKEENEQLRGYIEKLLVEIINHSPGVLEIKPYPRAESLRHNLTQ